MKLLTTIATTAAALAASLTLSAPAQADITFTPCPSGVSGVYAGHTSCDFADNVRATWFGFNGPTYLPNVYSPYTGKTYTMFCLPGYFAHLNGYTVTKLAVNCTGGDNGTAAVVFW